MADMPPERGLCVAILMTWACAVTAMGARQSTEAKATMMKIGLRNFTTSFCEHASPFCEADVVIYILYSGIEQ
jgi:hypothetical protein